MTPDPSSVAAPAPACVCGRLRRASRALTQLYDDAMAPADLRVTQFSLLRTLAQHGPMRVTALAATALLDRTALMRALAPLVARRLVTVRAGADARTRELALTRSGAAALRTATPYWERAQATVAGRLGAPDVAALVRLLRDIESLHPDATASST
jgi:DNA-binding MarR family transcriptional regulator